MRRDLSPPLFTLRIAMNTSRVNDGETPRAKGGGGGNYRSAITGQYVNTNHGKPSPNTTVKES